MELERDTPTNISFARLSLLNTGGRQTLSQRFSWYPSTWSYMAWQLGEHFWHYVMSIKWKKMRFSYEHCLFIVYFLKATNILWKVDIGEESPPTWHVVDSIVGIFQNSEITGISLGLKPKSVFFSSNMLTDVFFSFAELLLFHDQRVQYHLWLITRAITACCVRGSFEDLVVFIYENDKKRPHFIGLNNIIFIGQMTIATSFHLPTRKEWCGSVLTFCITEKCFRILIIFSPRM